MAAAHYAVPKRGGGLGHGGYEQPAPVKDKTENSWKQLGPVSNAADAARVPGLPQHFARSVERATRQRPDGMLAEMPVARKSAAGGSGPAGDSTQGMLHGSKRDLKETWGMKKLPYYPIKPPC
jgi:hypothetical protein